MVRWRHPEKGMASPGSFSPIRGDRIDCADCRMGHHGRRLPGWDWRGSRQRDAAMDGDERGIEAITEWKRSRRRKRQAPPQRPRHSRYQARQCRSCTCSTMRPWVTPVLLQRGRRQRGSAAATKDPAMTKTLAKANFCSMMDNLPEKLLLRTEPPCCNGGPSSRFRVLRQICPMPPRRRARVTLLLKKLSQQSTVPGRRRSLPTEAAAICLPARHFSA